MSTTESFRYGVPQERDWNAMSDEDFRALVRADFETHYPREQRFPPRRLRWHENKDWHLRMAAKGWIAPAWPVEYGGMGLSPRGGGVSPPHDWPSAEAGLAPTVFLRGARRAPDGPSRA